MLEINCTYGEGVRERLLLLLLLGVEWGGLEPLKNLPFLT